jgi:Mg2+/Co2+ transporter CorC
VLPVISANDHKITGILSYKDILSSYRSRLDEHEEGVAISLRRRTLKILVHGKKRLSVLKDKKNKS